MGTRLLMRCSVALVLTMSAVGCASTDGLSVRSDDAQMALPATDPEAFALASCHRHEDDPAAASEAVRTWDDPSKVNLGWPQFTALIEYFDAREWHRVEPREALPVRATDEVAFGGVLPPDVAGDPPVFLEPAGDLESDGRTLAAARSVIELAEEAHAGGATVWVGIGLDLEEGAEAHPVASVVALPDGQVARVGECTLESAPFTELDDAPAVVELLVAGDHDRARAVLAETWKDAREGAGPMEPWSQRPPSERALRDAPPEVAAQLVRIAAGVEIDPAWGSVDGARVCPVTSLGVGACLSLDAATGTPNADGVHRFWTEAVAGEPLELRLRWPSGEEELLATIPPEVAAGPFVVRRGAVVEADPGPPADDPLVRQGESGSPSNSASPAPTTPASPGR